MSSKDKKEPKITQKDLQQALQEELMLMFEGNREELIKKAKLRLEQKFNEPKIS